MIYLRFSAMSIFLASCAVLLAIGLGWGLVALAYSIFVMTVVDEFVGNSRRTVDQAKTFILNLFLHLSLPFLILLTAIFATFLSDGDPFAVIAMGNRLGFDIAAAREAAGPIHYAIGIALMGYLYGSGGINVAHELFHRTQSPLDVIAARWLLAFSWDTTFAIEHVHGHHRHVGTLQDPATARRGESLPAFWLRSSCGEIANGFRIEARRLDRRGHHWFSPHNKALRGQLMSLTITAAMYYAAGITGVLGFFAAAVGGKLMLESINYIEHYGLVRVEGTKVAPRHSWDSYRLLSNALLYNLPRHASHHMNASLKYWELKTFKDSPMLPMGYMSMILIALVPPLWRKVMNPRLREWDTQHATEQERNLIAERGWQV